MPDGLPAPESSMPSEKFNVSPSMLGLEKVDYNKLPNAFEVEEGILEGVELLRDMTKREDMEVGGVLVKDKAGKLSIRVAGEKGDGGFSLKMAEIDEENLDWFTGDQIYSKTKEGKPAFDIVFVQSKIAENFPQYFKGLMDIGTDVVFDRIPVGVVHTHPSGNLPSTGDFSHVVTSPPYSSSAKSEIVVTSDYVYFLVPTKQTPDLEEKVLMQGGREKWEADEDSTIHYLSEAAKNKEIGRESNSPLNAHRYQFLKQQCTENNVGFYILGIGDNVATRVF